MIFRKITEEQFFEIYNKYLNTECPLKDILKEYNYGKTGFFNAIKKLNFRFII